LRTRLARFIGEAFKSGEASGTLRGFYFTSGVQEGAPLDRLLAGVADVYQTTATTQAHSGRTYFLNRLLREVVFREAGLVQTGRAAREKQRKQLIGSLAAIGVATLIVIGLMAMNMLSDKSGAGTGTEVAALAPAGALAVAQPPNVMPPGSAGP
jgi:type VI secretion system protein ImpL